MNKVLKQFLANTKNKLFAELQLPAQAKQERRKDEQGILYEDPGAHIAIKAACDWLVASQKNSATQDGGSARHYSLATGAWSSSYPETTGYIIPTLLNEANLQSRPELSQVASKMLDWLVSIQFPEGGFQGGMVDQKPYVPVTFNTGQILLGLAAGAKTFNSPPIQEAMVRAANWLRDTQDADGCWRSFATPFAKPGEKSYETHVSWGLLEAARVGNDEGWSDAALKQVRWAISKQRQNGWMDACCLTDPNTPLTHTLGYCLKGVMEAWLFSKDQQYLDAAVRLAEPMRDLLDAQDRLPGRINADWQGVVPWTCLTGQVQIAWCWFVLFQVDGDVRWLEAAKRANRFVRRTMVFEGSESVRGGIKGSWPVNGGYGTFQYLNWAAKFAIDSFRKELDVLTKV
jgi:hypothetical protein